MDDQKLDQGGASSFEAYFAEVDIDNSITVHEDGRIEISGVMTGEEAIGRLMDAATRIRLFIERRALPATIEPLPPDDPALKRDDLRDLGFDELPSPPDVDDIPF